MENGRSICECASGNRIPSRSPCCPSESKCTRRTEFRAARSADIPPLLDNMRREDRDELVASVGFPYATVVWNGLRDATRAWTMLIGGEVAAVFGVSPRPEHGFGAPWLLGTTLLYRYGGRLVRFGPCYVDQMLTLYPALANHVDARNTRSIAWLRRLGFTIDAPSPIGPYGEPFHVFWMTR